MAGAGRQQEFSICLLLKCAPFKQMKVSNRQLDESRCQGVTHFEKHNIEMGVAGMKNFRQNNMVGWDSRTDLENAFTRAFFLLPHPLP